MQDPVRFGKYILLEKIATGGMAEVFLARPSASEANGRILVIKRILPHAAADSAFVRMFKTEIQICLGFTHPNTVQFHDFGEMSKQPYIAMEYVEGKNIRQLINKCTENGHKVPIAMATSIAAQAAAGLHYAHTFHNAVTGDDLRVIHRDISPQNLVISYEGNLKIIDFGIAKAALEIADRTQTGLLKGKVSYISPEQIAGLPADPRSDIFALGVVLWEMLTGQRLFCSPGDNELTILKRIQQCDAFITPPSQRNSLIPRDLDAIVLRCLAQNPEKRFQTAAELQKALREFLVSFQPGYSYSDVGKALRALFQTELTGERRTLMELNQRVQERLTNEKLRPPASLEKQAALIRMSYAGLLAKNRKATLRHYFLMGFCILTLIGFTLDQRYGLVSRMLAPAKVIQFASSEPPATPMRLVRDKKITLKPVAPSQAAGLRQSK